MKKFNAINCQWICVDKILHVFGLVTYVDLNYVPI